MKEQEIRETLSYIRNMMERSQKVMYIDGRSGIMAGIWALLGAVAVSLILSGSVCPLWGGSFNPVRTADAGTFLMVAVICAIVFAAAFLTVWIMSRRRARREGLDFTLDAGTRHMLGNFFTVMVTGGFLCLTPIANGHWELIPGYMLVFYGLAMVIVSPVLFRISVSKYMGYAQMAMGIAALCLPRYGMMFWTLGFCIFHLMWGIWFMIFFDRMK